MRHHALCFNGCFLFRNIGQTVHNDPLIHKRAISTVCIQPIFIDKQSDECAASGRGAVIERIVRIISEIHAHIRYCGVEVAVADFEAGAVAALTAPPERGTVVIDAATASGDLERGLELIAVTVGEKVVGALLNKTAGTLILIPADVEQRMNVGQAVAVGMDDHTCAHTGNAGVGDGVVVSFDLDSDGVCRAGSIDVDVSDIRVGRTGVCTVLDMQTHNGVFDGRVLHLGFPAGIDAHAVCDLVSVNNAAGQRVVAADLFYRIVRILSAQRDQRAACESAGCANDRIVCQLQIHAFGRIGRGTQRMG